MQIKELLDLANKGYDDGFLSEYYDDEGKLKEGFGDGLARFIVVELMETFDSDASEEEQRSTAMAAMDMARRDIEAVHTALHRGAS